MVELVVLFACLGGAIVGLVKRIELGSDPELWSYSKSKTDGQVEDKAA